MMASLTRICVIVAGVFFKESAGSGISGNLLRGMNNQILVILVEVQTSFVANSGKEAHWRKFALEGAAAWSPGTQRPSRTLPALLQNLSSRTNQWWLAFIFSLTEATNWNIATKQVTIFHSPYSSLTLHPFPALFGLKPFVRLAPRNLSLHCVFSTVFDPRSLDRILCCIYGWDISAVYFVFHILREVPSTGFCVRSLY